MKLRQALMLSALVLAAASAATAQVRCTRETLGVRGTPITIGYCVSGATRSYGGGELGITVDSTYSAAGGTLSRTRMLRFISFDGPSRLMESVELTRLGLTGTLHLTLVYAGGLVRIESAMLTPGAITIK